jgi:hypothetical protein
VSKKNQLLITIVVFITNEVMGQDIGTLVSNIDKALDRDPINSRKHLSP